MRHESGPRPSWLLDEMASIGRENLDEQHVARYDDKEDAHAEDEVRLLQSLGLERGSTLVELGAGTGQLALAAAQVCDHVIAVDPSPVMLRRLEEKVRAASASIEVVQAGFLTYEHAGDPPDLVYSRLALHHLPDLWKAVALRRVRRMLEPGATFRLWDVVFDFPLEQLEPRIERWCASLPVTAGEGEWTRADVEEHVRDEHSTFTWLLEPMIEQAGFEITEATRSDDRLWASYVLTAAP